MTHMRRFWIGGGGALLPLLVTLLALDLTSIIDNAGSYSVGTYVGTGLRYAVLFALGGIVATLNYDEKKPIKLVQLGIAAPALIASYVNAQAPAAAPPRNASVPAVVRVADFSFISSAQAAEIVDRSEQPIFVADFFRDVFRAATRPLPAQDTVKQEAAKQEIIVDRIQIQQAIEDVKKSAERTAVAAEKAATDTALAVKDSSPEALAAALESAAKASTAAQNTESNTKVLLDTAKVLTRPAI
jgi:hypothetical protein